MSIANVRIDLALALTFALAAASPAGFAQESKKPLEFVVDGQIVAADGKDTVRMMPCKIHVLKLEQGRTYVIDMVSKDFDAFLRLENSEGKQLAQDDDGGGMNNARIRFTAPRDDSYKIIATSFLGGEGAYRLTVKDANAPVAVGKKPPMPAGDPPAKKDDIVQPAGKAPEAETLNAPTLVKPVKVMSRLENGDPVDPMQNQNAKYFRIDLDGETAYTIRMESNDFDAYLRIEDAAGKVLAFDDDGGGDLHAQMVFIAPAKGVYRIVATSFKGGAGAFALSVKLTSDLGKAVKYDAEKVHDVGAGFFIPASLTRQDARDAVKRGSPCHVHQVKLEKDKTYIVDLMSSQMDAYLRIENDQKANLAEDDDGGDGLNSRLEFSPGETGVFRLVATNLNGGPGTYILRVREKN